jgi:solute carrier family 8 (sodium/calcium exchanger)
MGHCAKYGSYSLLDLERNKIIAMELVQINEVTSSYHMELEGLQRCKAKLDDRGVIVSSLVTDRHLQVGKWVREEWGQVKHQYDVWHVAKSLKKKLEEIAKKRGNEIVKQWSHSITNHLYWCAISSNGNGCLALAKWESILNHICNIHEGHGLLFTSCAHGQLEGESLKKEWFRASSKVFDQLSNIVLSKNIKRDVQRLSPLGQTFSVEGFHSLVNHFAPKMTHFGYCGMLCRLLLAALHYNENAGRKQAVNRDGKLEYQILYPKYKKGDHIVRGIKVASTYNYIKELFNDLTQLAETTSLCSLQPVIDVTIPPSLCASKKQVKKNDAVLAHCTRFNKRKRIISECEDNDNTST